MKFKFITIAFFTVICFACSNDDDSGENTNLEGQGQSLLAFTAFGDLNCGEIIITVEGLGTKTMDGEDPPMGFVDCQDTSPSIAQWDDIPDGVYNYTGTCASYTWTGSRTLGVGSCSYLALTAGSAD